MELLEEVGSPGRARTADLVINSHSLYRLSYRGTKGPYVKASAAIGQSQPRFNSRKY